MKLSIIIPAFNEEKTIAKVIENVAKLKIPNTEKEIIIVDDGSFDHTEKQIKKAVKNRRGIKILTHKRNMGKGAAVKTGIKSSTGDYVVIQDADLEYNPKYIGKLLTEIKNGEKIVVYGTRLKRLPNLKREEKTFQFLIHYFGNRFLSLTTSVLYGQWITDMETGYKLFPRSAVRRMKLNARGFELEPEITSKLMKRGYLIREIPITANPRGYDEGKKINTVKDGVKALWYLFKYRFND